MSCNYEINQESRFDSLDRILVIRLSAMGDIILTTPVLRWIRQTFPECKLDVLVKSEYQSLLDGHPDVNKTYGLPSEGGLKTLRKTRHFIRSQRYDAVIDLQANSKSRWLACRSGAFRVARYRPWRWQRFFLVNLKLNVYHCEQPVPLRYLKSVESWGIRDYGDGAALFPSDAIRENAMRILDGMAADRLIVLAPGAGRQTKQWPAERFAEVGQKLQKQGFQIVFAGAESDREPCEGVAQSLPEKSLNLAGRLSMMETAAVLERSRLLITNDTGLMHMAGAVQTAVVAIFGPTTRPLGFFPFRSKNRVVEIKGLKCRPCSFHGTRRCPQGHFRCMREIQPETVLDAVESVIS